MIKSHLVIFAARYRGIFQILISYNRAMGRFSDVVWWDLFITDRKGMLLPYDKFKCWELAVSANIAKAFSHFLPSVVPASLLISSPHFRPYSFTGAEYSLDIHLFMYDIARFLVLQIVGQGRVTTRQKYWEISRLVAIGVWSKGEIDTFKRPIYISPSNWLATSNPSVSSSLLDVISRLYTIGSRHIYTDQRHGEMKYRTLRVKEHMCR